MRGCGINRVPSVYKCLSTTVDKLFKLPKPGLPYLFHGPNNSSNLTNFSMGSK